MSSCAFVVNVIVAADLRRAVGDEARPRCGAVAGPEERQQPPADNHADPQAERDDGDEFRRARRIGRRVRRSRAAIRRDVERQRVRAGEHDEQHLELERRVVDVLIRFGQQEQRPAGDVDREAQESPGNQLVQRGDGDPFGHSEEPQIEQPDAADEHRQTEEVDALGHRPAPLRPHELRDRRRRIREPVHERDLKIGHLNVPPSDAGRCTRAAARP